MHRKHLWGGRQEDGEAVIRRSSGQTCENERAMALSFILIDRATGDKPPSGVISRWGGSPCSIFLAPPISVEWVADLKAREPEKKSYTMRPEMITQIIQKQFFCVTDVRALEH